MNILFALPPLFDVMCIIAISLCVLIARVFLCNCNVLCIISLINDAQ